MSNRTRVTGMYSGLDTESLISQLVEAKKTKVTSTTKDQLTIQYKQDAWKDLNKKLKNLQTKFDSLRYSSAYAKKTTEVSDSSVASVVTADTAMTATQSLKVTSLAKAGYATGNEIKTKDGEKATSGTLLKDIEGVEVGSKLSIKVGGKTTDIEITEDMTLGSFTGKLSSGGVNANFDSATQRIFIGAKDTGTDSDFLITASNMSGINALNKLGIMDDFSDKDSAIFKEYERIRNIPLNGTEFNSIVKENTDKKVNALLDEYKTLHSRSIAIDKAQAELEEKYGDDSIKLTKLKTYDKDVYEEKLEYFNKQLEEADGEEAKKAIQEEIDLLNDSKAYAENKDLLAKTRERMGEIEERIDIVTEIDDDGNEVVKSASDKLGENGKGINEQEAYDELQAKRSTAYNVINGTNGVDPSKYSFTSRVQGADAEIELNGAKFTGSSNTFNINGLTITAKQETGDKAVTLNTTNDTSAMYDMIKSVIKEYSEVINELDKLYNADTKTKYKPLTDEEKSAMSDYEVEKWEDKMKEQLLAKDSTVNTIASAFREIMNSGYEVNGKKMYLFDFGIETAGYFNAADNEKNALHIYGDADDDLFSTETNKLKAAIASDPDSVAEFFSQLSRSIYDKMSSLSSRQSGYRSFGSFYDDVKMKSDYDDYTSKIADMEDKLSAYEDKWYDKFSKMETAMAKMQSNQNALSNMFG